MKSHSITPEILFGGSGSRLRPLSRNDLPKQFLNISGELSLFQESRLRLQQLILKFYLNKIKVVTNEEYHSLIIKQPQAIKSIIKKFARKKRYEYKSHGKVTRPLGCFDTLDYDDRFKVKSIQVNPGVSLCLHSHKNRAEHWVVVKGVSKIISGQKAQVLKEVESTYIPALIKHKLYNQSKDILEIIEVQSGVDLNEDDIERFKDNCGRMK